MSSVASLTDYFAREANLGVSSFKVGMGVPELPQNLASHQTDNTANQIHTGIAQNLGVAEHGDAARNPQNNLPNAGSARAMAVFRQAFKDGELLAITQENLSNDLKSGTQRLSSSELKKFKCDVEDGVIKNASGDKISSTEGFNSHNKAGMAAFVLSVDKKFFLFNHLNKTDKIAHSSFAGQFAKGAGEMAIKDSKIDLIHAHSGHFRPNALNVFHVLNHFSDLDAIGPNAKVGFVEDPFPDIGKPKPACQQTVSFEHSLDPDDEKSLKNAESVIKSGNEKLADLKLAHPEASFHEYKNSLIAESKSNLDAVKNDANLKTFFGEKGHAEYVEGKEQELADAQSLTYQGYLDDKGKDIQKEIDGAQDIVDGLKNGGKEKIEFVYDANEFKTFVAENFDALKAKMDPAFFKR